MATGGSAGKGAPGVPDYMGAATQMGQQSLYNTQYQTYANRPDITTPQGSITWEAPEYTSPGGTAAPTGTDPDGAVQPVPGLLGPWGPPQLSDDAGATGTGYPEPGRWGVNVALSPEAQAAYDAQQRLGAARSGLGETLFGRAQTELGAAPDWAGLPGAPDAAGARQQAIDATYGQAQSRLNPQWDQRGEALRTQMLNEGLSPGMQGYDQRMQEFERSRTDAYDTAMRSSIMAGEPVAAGEFSRGLQGRQQGVAEMLQRRGATLNEINALLGGTQVGMPQSPNFSQANMAQTPDYLGAMGNQYGAQLNQYNAQQAQLQSLMGGAASIAPYLMML